MATAPTTSHRPSLPPDVSSRFVRTVLPLTLTLLAGATVLGAIVWLVVYYVQHRGTENEFVFRRLEETTSLFGKEIDPRLWLALVIPLLAIGFTYAGWQYVRDGRAVGPAWAAFMALLRCTVYGVLAFAFLLPATQSWEISRNQSKMIIVFDTSPSMVFLKDDVPTDAVPFAKLPARQDKVLQFLADGKVNFLGRIQAKNPLTAYRFGRLLDENYHVFQRTEAGGEHYNREEWDQLQHDPAAAKERELSKKEWSGDDWQAWLKPRFDAPVQDLPEAERNKVLKEIDENHHIFAATNLGDPLVSMLNREGNNLIQGIVVVSDGRSTEGSPAAIKELTDRAKKNKIPIFVIAVGEDRPRVQLEFTDLRLPKQVRPEDQFPIVAELNGPGLAGEEVEVHFDAYRPSNPKERIELPPVKVKFSGGQIPHAQAEITINPAMFPISGAVEGQPPPKPGEEGKREYEEGEWRFVARVAKDKREVFPDPEHKTDPAGLRVVKKPISVLLMASGPSREYQFVRTFFVREMEKGRADVCIYLQPPPLRDPREGVVQDVDPSRMLKTFPDRFEDAGKAGETEEFSNLGHYDLLIAFDPDWTRLDALQMQMVQRWVDLGHGLIVVGGPVHTIELAKPGATGSAIRPILDLYPVILHDSRLQELDRPTNEPWRLNLTGVTPEMEFMRLDENQDAMTQPLKPWEDFFYGAEMPGGARPPAPIRGFFNYYPSKFAKDGTQVIATFGDPRAKTDAGREQPFLAVMPYGTGKVFWMASGEMWRLRAYREAYHERFWAKLARFVGSGSLTQINKRISPIHGRTFPANTFVTLDAKILAKDMKPLDERAKPKLVLVPPRGALEKDQTLEMGKKLSTAEGWTGTFTTRFLARTPGEYQYRIEVAETGDTESGKFVVKESNPELDNTRPDFEQLWDLASEADDYLVRIKDEETRRLVKETLTRPRPVSAEEGEKKPGAKAEDRPRFLFDLKTAELIPDCVTYDYREQRSRGAADDWWDNGFPTDKPKNERWFSWILALVVALLSAEWLARKLLRLA